MTSFITEKEQEASAILNYLNVFLLTYKSYKAGTFNRKSNLSIKGCFGGKKNRQNMKFPEQ